VDRFYELNTFIAVVEAGGFSAAARTSGDSQSAISKAIGALEKRLGVMLFNRSTRRVTLTDHGRRYYDRTKPLLDEMQDVDGELTRSTLGVSGLIRIAASATFPRIASPNFVTGCLTNDVTSTLTLGGVCPEYFIDLKPSAV
jgi:DNA-binding transcriptional LysR family regulator